MGLDVGARRVGVAVSDELGMIASPVTSVDLKREGVAGLRALIDQYRPRKLVVGLPTSMRGTEGAQAAETRSFARELQEQTGLAVTYWDERLTTALAERALVATGHRRRARKERVDAVAAALILQSYLDSGRR